MKDQSERALDLASRLEGGQYLLSKDDRVVTARALRLLASYGSDAPDWPPRASAVGLPEAEQRYGSTGQLFEVRGGRWVRLPAAPPQPAPDALREALEADYLKAICNAGNRCSCADKNWQWRDHQCNIRMAHVKAIVAFALSPSPSGEPLAGDGTRPVGRTR